MIERKRLCFILSISSTSTYLFCRRKKDRVEESRVSHCHEWRRKMFIHTAYFSSITSLHCNSTSYIYKYIQMYIEEFFRETGSFLSFLKTCLHWTKICKKSKIGEQTWYTKLLHVASWLNIAIFSAFVVVVVYWCICRMDLSHEPIVTTTT